MGRTFKRILLGALLTLGAAAAVVVYKLGPQNIWGMLRYDTRREGDLKPGDRAPEVALTELDGVTRTPLLGAAATRPRVLVFGSFT